MIEWYVVDIGNSAVKAGRFRDGELTGTVRIPLREGRIDLDDEFARFLAAGRVDRTAVASVVPSVTQDVVDRLVEASGDAPFRLDASVPLPFSLAYETPVTLGADRLAAAAGAWTWSARALPMRRVAIAVDAGTAVNMEVVVSTSDGPVYLGGVIAPGPELVRRSLRVGTAQLPEVPLEWPDRIVGSSTRSALQAGILPGFVHAVDGIVQQIEQELGHRAAVVVTGGWGSLLARQLPRIDHSDPDLVLRGIREIAAINRSR